MQISINWEGVKSALKVLVEKADFSFLDQILNPETKPRLRMEKILTVDFLPSVDFPVANISDAGTEAWTLRDLAVTYGLISNTVPRKGVWKLERKFGLLLLRTQLAEKQLALLKFIEGEKVGPVLTFGPDKVQEAAQALETTNEYVYALLQVLAQQGFFFRKEEGGKKGFTLFFEESPEPETGQPAPDAAKKGLMVEDYLRQLADEDAELQTQSVKLAQELLDAEEEHRNKMEALQKELETTRESLREKMRQLSIRRDQINGVTRFIRDDISKREGE